MDRPLSPMEQRSAEIHRECEALAPRLMGLTEHEARALVEAEGRTLRVIYRYPDTPSVWHNDGRSNRINVMLDLWGRIGVVSVG